MALVEASKQNNERVADSIMKTYESVAAMAESHVSLTARLTGGAPGGGVARQIGFGEEITEVVGRCAVRVRRVRTLNAQLCMESILEVESELAAIACELERGARILSLLVHSGFSRVQLGSKRCGDGVPTDSVGGQTRQRQFAAARQEAEERLVNAAGAWRGGVSLAGAGTDECAQGGALGMFAKLLGPCERTEEEGAGLGACTAWSVSATYSHGRAKVRRHTWLVALLMMLGWFGRVAGSETTQALGYAAAMSMENHASCVPLVHLTAASAGRLQDRRDGVALVVYEEQGGWSAWSSRNPAVVAITAGCAICDREQAQSAMRGVR